MTELILPKHTDVRGMALGGQVLSWIDIVASIAAKKHSGMFCVTRCVDEVHFIAPIKVGDLLILDAYVNRAWRTSMEVHVDVWSEHMLTGQRKHHCQAYLTFVARPTSPVASSTATGAPALVVPPVVPVTDAECARYHLAERRRQARLDAYAKTPSDERREQRHHDIFEEIKARYEALLANPKPPVSSESDRMQAKDIACSYTELVEFVLPQHANSLQITFGGQIIEWMEACATASAVRHARSHMLTASIDSLQFYRPTRVGDIVNLRAFVTRAFKSSMEVLVTIDAVNLQTGEKTAFASEGVLTLVAVDENGSPQPVPPALQQTDAERALAAEALQRRQKRLAHVASLKTREESHYGLAD